MNKKAKTSLIAFVVAAILIASCIGFYAYTKISDDIKGKNQSDSKYTLEITKNDFQYEVSEKLAQNGMVISAAAWSNWMDKHYPKFEYTNGEYYMTADMSYEEIVNKLNNPDISHKTVKVCVPEGTNAMQIAALMQDNGICSADDFLSACKKAGDYDYAFLASVPDSDLIGYQLEGFLFPATYDVGLNTPAKQVVSMMLDAFGEHLTADMTRFCEENNMTLYQLLTLASVVQEEAFGVSSAKNIASVFINRLNKGIKLQSDVTYFYARDLRDDYGFSQQVYEAYYTYRCDALPVGPISNSGDDIIDATVNAPTTDYMYFFSDLQKEFHFAKTAEEFVQLQKQFPWQ